MRPLQKNLYQINLLIIKYDVLLERYFCRGLKYFNLITLYINKL